jgi:hypothetical protein
MEAVRQEGGDEYQDTLPRWQDRFCGRSEVGGAAM